jgi:hypothetical protein
VVTALGDPHTQGRARAFSWQVATSVARAISLGRVAGGQGDDAATLQLPKPRRPPGAGQIAQPIDAAGIEAVQPAVDRARMAVQRLGDLADLGAVPAQGDDAGALQPTRRCVAGGGEFADAALLGGVGGWSGEQRRQYGSPPASQGTQHIKRALLHLAITALDVLHQTP